MSRQQRQNQELEQSNWREAIKDRYDQCEKVLSQAIVDVSDPERALWPVVPRKQMTREHLTVAQAHATILRLADRVEPFSDRCAGFWTEQITTHEFPDGQRIDVCLDELGSWADIRYETEETVQHELIGRKSTKNVYRVHLPVKYSRKCHKMLYNCICDIDLVDLPTPDYTIDGPDEAW